MKKLISILGALFLSFFILSFISFAQHQHGGMSMGVQMKMDKRTVIVEGVKVTFEFMADEDHREMLKSMKMMEDIEPGTTHNITVTLNDETTQKEITDAQVKLKVIDAKGKEQTKSMKYDDMMKTFDAYFNLPEKGEYQVIVVFKRGDRKPTHAGVYYEIK